MNRLTIPDEKLPDGGMRMTVVDARKVAEHAMEFYSRLKKYEDLEDAGRLVRLRAGIGDVVYAIIDGKVVPMQIQYLYINSNGRVRYHAAEAVLEKNFRDPAFGRDVFTSREAAERKVAGHAR